MPTRIWTRPALLAPSLTACLLLASGCAEDRDRGDGSLEPPPPARPIDAATTIAAANANLRNVMSGAARASAFADESRVLKDLTSGSTDCSTSDPVGPGGSGGGGGTGSGDGTTCGGDLAFEDDATDLADELAARALNIANIEVTEPTRIVLLLDPARVCTAIASRGDDAPEPPPTSPPEPDAECVSAFQATPIRLELTSRSEGDVDVAILVGAAQARPITISLHTTSIAIEVDLAAAKAGIEAFVTAFGGDADYLPEVMTGRVRVSLTKNGERDFTATAAVLAAIRVTSTNADVPYDVSIAAAPNAGTLHIDGDAEELTGSTDLGAILLELPLDELFSSDSAPTNCTTGPDGMVTCDPPVETTPVTGTMRFSVAALTGSIVARGADDSVELTGVGFGPDALRLTADGAPLFALDLNASAGRSADLTLRSVDGGLSVQATPRLELAASFDFASAEARGAEVTSWMRDDDLSFSLSGGAMPLMVLQDLGGDARSDPIPPPGGGGGGAPLPPEEPSVIARVVSGTLSIGSRAAGRTVIVPAGQCLSQSDAADGDHPISQLSSGLCP